MVLINKIEKGQNIGKAENESFLIYHVFRPISKYFTKIFVLLKFSPNTVSYLGFLIALIACYFLYLGDKNSLIISGILIYFSIVMSASDGEVARITNKASKFGDFIDSISDISKFWLFMFFS